MLLAEGGRRIKGVADVLHWRSEEDGQQLQKSQWTKRIRRKNKGINSEGVEMRDARSSIWVNVLVMPRD